MSGHWNIFGSSLAGAMVGYLLTMPLMLSNVEFNSVVELSVQAVTAGQPLIALCALAGGLGSLAMIRAQQRQRLRLLAVQLENTK